MKKLSLWAKNHPSNSVLLVVLIKLFLLFLACFLGWLFIRASIHLSYLFFIPFFVGAAIAFFLYPPKNKNKKTYYNQRKWCDFFIALGGFASIVFMVNNRGIIHFENVEALYTVTTSYPLKDSNITKNKQSSFLTHFNFTKKEGRHPVKMLVKLLSKKNEVTAGDAFLIILTIIFGLGLLVLLTALVCDLSCSGNDGLAIMLALVGTTAIIVGSYFVINRILKKSKLNTAHKLNFISKLLNRTKASTK